MLAITDEIPRNTGGGGTGIAIEPGGPVRTNQLVFDICLYWWPGAHFDRESRRPRTRIFNTRPRPMAARF